MFKHDGIGRVWAYLYRFIEFISFWLCWSLLKNGVFISIDVSASSAEAAASDKKQKPPKTAFASVTSSFVNRGDYIYTWLRKTQQRRSSEVGKITDGGGNYTGVPAASFATSLLQLC